MIVIVLEHKLHFLPVLSSVHIALAPRHHSKEHPGPSHTDQQS